ncbi:MAG: hypothetical protein ACQETH_17250 [Candidatus Rifleibacteriota bacterium]
MYSERLLKMLEAKARVYKVIWLLLPLQILMLTAVAWVILRFAFHPEPLQEKVLLNVFTFIFTGGSLVVVILGIKVRGTLFNSKLTEVDSGVDREFASADAREGLKSLSYTELLIFKAFHSALSRTILLCAFFEAPVISGLVLTLLSGSPAYCILGSAISLILWRKYIPAPVAFRKEFFEVVDEQLKKFGKPTE